ncbi:MipA/OmpV family protein [Enterobacteriaceae bacterium H11S18]|nr:MipA/OmpV family protein [Dryocola clanedunensis]MCT4713380.1 MipA/OmpV family protein [Dryocola clanedunensis]
MRLNQLTFSALCSVLLLSGYARAEIDLGSIDLFSKDSASSPIPKGLIVGGAAVTGTHRYKAEDTKTYFIPGALYFGDQFMYLGDRGRYYFALNDSFAAYGYGRYRFGNLDPDDHHEFAGMHKRRGEFEAGVGGTIITPYALLSARISSDVTGQSNGQELLLWADFPVVRGRLLIMPGVGMMIRSDKMANYYFGGVSSGEATAQRKEWDTGTTFSPMTAIITSYRFNDKWMAMFAANYEFYDKSIADSPLVQHDGELYTIAAVGYTW